MAKLVPFSTYNGRSIYINADLVRSISESQSGKAIIHFDSEHTTTLDVDAAQAQTKLNNSV